MAHAPTTRRRVTAAAGLLLALVMLTSCLQPGQSDALAALNKDRTELKLKALPTQADAQKKAQAWAERLARENTLYHSTLSDGIKTKWCSIGENVGYGPSVEDIQEAYMNSPAHRANIVATKWNGVGIGYATNGKRIFTVQVFIKTC